MLYWCVGAVWCICAYPPCPPGFGFVCNSSPKCLTSAYLAWAVKQALLFRRTREDVTRPVLLPLFSYSPPRLTPAAALPFTDDPGSLCPWALKRGGLVWAVVARTDSDLPQWDLAGSVQFWLLPQGFFLVLLCDTGLLYRVGQEGEDPLPDWQHKEASGLPGAPRGTRVACRGLWRRVGFSQTLLGLPGFKSH